jgi:hypothetical protein
MRSAILAVLVCPILAAAQDKKPEPITSENIEVGRVGTIEKLVVEKVLQVPDDPAKHPDLHLLVANFGTVRVMVQGYPVAVGQGKTLPKDQLWKVDCILKDDFGERLKGCYMLKPETPKKK